MKYLGFLSRSGTVDVKEQKARTDKQQRDTTIFTSDGTATDKTRDRAVESNTVSALPPSI